MQFYETLYKTARKVVRPIHRRSRLNRIAVFDLGKGLPNRQGRALVSYVSDFVRFVTHQGSAAVWGQPNADEVLDALCAGKFAGHYHHRESADLVLQLIRRGFVVDCIYDRGGHLLEDVSRYDLILEEWDNLPRFAAEAPRARKCFYGTTCHWLYWNRAELQRLDWLFKRRGVALAPERQLPAMLRLEDAMVVTYYGNDYAVGHYGVYRPKLRKIAVCPAVPSGGFNTKVWATAKRRFLYFGSASWVHRGLDLVIEAFLQTDLELFICGPDQRYSTVYGEELARHKNIRHMGFVTPDSEQFQNLMCTTCGVVYASAAEGCSTSVVQCIRFGLIPVVTQEVGLSVHDFWPALSGASDRELIADIVRRCTELSQVPDAEIAELSRRFWEFADTHHSRQAFRSSLSTVLDELLR